MREREPLILGHVFLQQNLDPASTGQPAPSAAGGQCCGFVPGLSVKSPVLLTSEEQCAKTRRAASGAQQPCVERWRARRGSPPAGLLFDGASRFQNTSSRGENPDVSPRLMGRTAVRASRLSPSTGHEGRKSEHLICD